VRRPWRTITGLAAGLALATTGLVAAPAASANGVPAAPTITGAVVLPQAANTAATGGKVDLTWTGDPLPADDTAWTVTATPVSGTTLTQNVRGTGDSPVTATVSGLTMGISYTFTVKGNNASGASDASPASSAVIPYATPTPPLSVSALAGNAQVSVSWAAPANSGGVPITSYTATATATGAAAITSATCQPNPVTGTSCTIGPLTNGAQYAVTVTATNQGAGAATPGAGTTSAASAAVPVTPTATSGLPAAPTGVSAVAVGSGSVEVSFTPPAPVPGFPFTAMGAGFSATCTSTNGGTQGGPTPVSAGSPITVTGLTNDKTYRCTVTATNANGNSPASSASNLVVPKPGTLPSQPTAVTATGGAQQATLSWTAPTTGSPFGNYQVRYTPVGSTTSGPITTGSSARSFTVTDLAAGQYQFEVRAINDVGAGAWSNPSSVVTVTAGSLNAPTAVTATPRADNRVVLTWTAPTGGTLAPTSYRVQYSVNTATPAWTILDPTGTTSTTATVSNLTNGTAYVFQVAALNGDVASAWSTSSAAATPGTPDLPTDLAGTAGNAQVVLTWKAPAAAAGVPVPTGYEVQYQVSGTTTWLPSTPLSATALTRTVTGLTNGTAYVFRVRSVNGSTVDPDAVPGAWTTTNPTLTPVAPETRTIEIEGDRGTGSDRNRIFVEGTSTGLVGQRVTPYFRLPGQTGFTAGTGTRVVAADGTFSWTRKTGKRIAVQFRFGNLRSDRIIIEAR